MPNGTYGGVRGRKITVVKKILRYFPPTRFARQGTALRVAMKNTDCTDKTEMGRRLRCARR